MIFKEISSHPICPLVPKGNHHLSFWIFPEICLYAYAVIWGLFLLIQTVSIYNKGNKNKDQETSRKSIAEPDLEPRPLLKLVFCVSVVHSDSLTRRLHSECSAKCQRYKG